MPFSSLLLAAFALHHPPQAKPEAVPQAPPAPVDVTQVKAVPYNPTVKREPFRALGEDRKPGDADIIDDIAVKGFTRRDGKFYAVVADSRGMIREMEVGHPFKDGVIAAIDTKGVTFHQWDPSTTNRKIFKVVVKTFKREESTR